MTEEERERREQIKEAQKQGQEAAKGLWQNFKKMTGSKVDDNGNLGPMTKQGKIVFLGIVIILILIAACDL
ncbi:MAG: hypothetical protein J6R67_02415 [Treponema sp.]|nr:hypothetical protein [Treponema sp.]